MGDRTEEALPHGNREDDIDVFSRSRSRRVPRDPIPPLKIVVGVAESQIPSTWFIPSVRLSETGNAADLNRHSVFVMSTHDDVNCGKKIFDVNDRTSVVAVRCNFNPLDVRLPRFT